MAKGTSGGKWRKRKSSTVREHEDEGVECPLSGTNDEGGGKVQKREPSRKEIRKNLRKMKKQKKHEYLTTRKQARQVDTPNVKSGKKQNIKSTVEEENFSHDEDHEALQDAKKAKPTKKKEPVVKKKNENAEKERQKQRVKQLRVANKLEDKNIKKMEKQLRLNKRKSKSMPKSFVNDGLDYLLEVCDADKRAEFVKEEFDFADNDAGFEEDLAIVSNKAAPVEEKTFKKKKSSNLKASKKSSSKAAKESSEEESDFGSDEEMSEPESGDFGEESGLSDQEDFDRTNESEEEDLEGADEFDEEDFDGASNMSHEEDVDDASNPSNEVDSNGASDQSGDDDSEKESSNLDGSSDKNGFWQDIYGRTRDKKGQVVTENKGKYVPPGKRLALAADGDQSAETIQLKRQMKGLLNRLSEANLAGIVSTIEQLYLSHSRHTMQGVINSLIMDALIVDVQSPERLVMEHCVLIAALHANVDVQVGAQFLEAVVRRFDAQYKAVPDGNYSDKQVDNMILIMAHLYNFGVVAAPLLSDVLNRLAERFAEKDIELILIVLRSVGFALRKDDPVALKEIILTLQSKATHAADQTNRVRFMLDTLLAIRNNNMAKIPNYDPTYTEHLRKLLRNGVVRKGVSLSKLNISLKELLAADQRGRWWIVGSAWVGQGPIDDDAGPATGKSLESDNAMENKFSAELLELARKQRMNTDVRRNIFCVLMTAEDYIEAFDRLLRLGLKPQQEREIVHVIVDCCLHEKQFNPYYAHLMHKLCNSHRRFQMATQFALWDRFQDLNNLSQLQLAHLAKLVVHLVAEQATTLAVLKVIQFADMDRVLVRFLRHILLGLLLHPSEAAVQSAFLQIAGKEKLSVLKEGLTLFMHHFVDKNADKLHGEQAGQLRQRVQLAQQALQLGSACHL